MPRFPQILSFMIQLEQTAFVEWKKSIINQMNLIKYLSVSSGSVLSGFCYLYSTIFPTFHFCRVLGGMQFQCINFSSSNNFLDFHQQMNET